MHVRYGSLMEGHLALRQLRDEITLTIAVVGLLLTIHRLRKRHVGYLRLQWIPLWLHRRLHRRWKRMTERP